MKSINVEKAAKIYLDLAHNLIELKEQSEYKEIASALLASIENHSWYLADNIIMLYLLDDDVDNFHVRLHKDSRKYMGFQIENARGEVEFFIDMVMMYGLSIAT